MPARWRSHPEMGYTTLSAYYFQLFMMERWLQDGVGKPQEHFLLAFHVPARYDYMQGWRAATRNCRLILLNRKFFAMKHTLSQIARYLAILTALNATLSCRRKPAPAAVTPPAAIAPQRSAPMAANSNNNLPAPDKNNSNAKSTVKITRNDNGNRFNGAKPTKEPMTDMP